MESAVSAMTKAFRESEMDCNQWSNAVLCELAVVAIAGLRRADLLVVRADYLGLLEDIATKGPNYR